MKIVLSIIGKCIDDFSKVHDTNIDYAYVTWDQVKEMQKSGYVEIQNHSYNLHQITCDRYGCYLKTNEPFSDYEKILSADLLKLQITVDDVTGFTPNTFAYPYGKYNDSTETIIKELGFKATLSCTFGVNKISKDDPNILYGLKRICRSHKNGIGKMIEEGMKTIH